MKDDTGRQDEHFLEDDIAPHPKQNMTSQFGRLVERTTYLDVVILAGVILLVSTLWFSFFAPNGHGLKDAGASFLACLYFSLVTFTSLGYGEMVPVGFGRVFAILDVLSGLALTAVLIGKVASERQSSILLLLHTSDTQRRISDFSKELESSRGRIQLLTEQKNICELNRTLEAHLRLIKAIKNYLMFNANQASVVEFGNFTALIGLYDEIRETFDVVSKLHRHSEELMDLKVMRRSFSNMNNLNQIVRRMGVLHHKSRSRDPLWQTALRAIGVWDATAPPPVEQSARNRLRALEKHMGARIADADNWIRHGHHPIQVEHVFQAFPTGPRSMWPTGIHKAVASRLGISNTISARCVTDLLTANRLPKHVKDRGRTDATRE